MVPALCTHPPPSVPAPQLWLCHKHRVSPITLGRWRRWVGWQHLVRAVRKHPAHATSQNAASCAGSVPSPLDMSEETGATSKLGVPKAPKRVGTQLHSVRCKWGYNQATKSCQVQVMAFVPCALVQGKAARAPATTHLLPVHGQRNWRILGWKRALSSSR